MKFRNVCVAALLAPGIAGAGDLLSQEQYIDYQAQMKCAEALYSYRDPDRYEKEQSKIDKAFKVSEQDIETGRMDTMAEKYGADAGVLDAIDVKVAALCPTPAE